MIQQPQRSPLHSLTVFLRQAAGASVAATLLLSCTKTETLTFTVDVPAGLSCSTELGTRVMSVAISTERGLQECLTVPNPITDAARLSDLFAARGFVARDLEDGQRLQLDAFREPCTAKDAAPAASARIYCAKTDPIPPATGSSVRALIQCPAQCPNTPPLTRDAGGDGGTDRDADTADVQTHTDATPNRDGAPSEGAVPGVLVDESFADFSAGVLSGAGRKLYLTAAGQITILDNTDIDGDGFTDLVINSSVRGRDRRLDSKIYKGSASGFSATTPFTGLPTIGSRANAIGDLNHDGFPDIVFANYFDGTADLSQCKTQGQCYRIDSFIYWGAQGGHSANNKTALPTMGANDVSIADIDRDGYLDLVFANQNDDKSRIVDSYVYWGGKDGFDTQAGRTTLGTLGATDSEVADFDHDGKLDVIFCNQYTDGAGAVAGNVNSYIYWNEGQRTFSATPTKLATHNCQGVAVASLNPTEDDHLDVVFTNFWNGNYNTDSFVYWGQPGRTFLTTPTKIPTVGARSVSVADLNTDGQVDIVVSNQWDGANFALGSYIYWGGVGRAFAPAQRSEVPTVGVEGNFIAHLDGDNALDLFFGSFFNGSSHDLNSVVQKGPLTPSGIGTKIDLPTVGASRSTTSDLGDVAGRRGRYTFISRVHDTGVDAPAYDQLLWTASLPNGATLTLQLRSADSRSALNQATWTGPSATQTSYTTSGTPINAVHQAQRFIQYRATFTTRYLGRPELDRVEIRLR